MNQESKNAAKPAITINDEIPVGPVLAVVFLIIYVAQGTLPWQLIPVIILFSLGDSITVNWRKLRRRKSH